MKGLQLNKNRQPFLATDPESGSCSAPLTQNEVGAEDVEDCGERAADVVERHVHVLQAQVVEHDHTDEHDRQGQHLQRKTETVSLRRRFTGNDMVPNSNKQLKCNVKRKCPQR